MTGVEGTAKLRDLVRPEALEKHTKAIGPGRLLGIDPRATTMAFRLLIASLVAGAAISATLKVNEETVGRGVMMSDGNAMIVVRGGALPRLRPSLAVRLVLDGRTVDGTIAEVGPPASAHQVAARIGGRPEGVAPGDIVATARVTVDEAVRAGATGRARVLISRRSIAEALVQRTPGAPRG